MRMPRVARACIFGRRWGARESGSVTNVTRLEGPGPGVTQTDAKIQHSTSILDLSGGAKVALRSNVLAVDSCF